MSFAQSFRAKRAPLGWIALLRVFVGAVFLYYGQQKLLDVGGFTGQLEGMLKEWAGASTIPWYKDFLLTTVLPKVALFSWLVALGEVAAGGALFLGLFSRLAALAGMFMSLNYLFATWHLGPASRGFNSTFALVQFVLIVTGAGRAWGIDYWLARRWPRCPLW